MTVFMVVSVDKYELPLAVGETYAECAKVFGVDPAAHRPRLTIITHTSGSWGRNIAGGEE